MANGNMKGNGQNQNPINNAVAIKHAKTDNAKIQISIYMIVLKEFAATRKPGNLRKVQKSVVLKLILKKHATGELTAEMILE